MDFYGLKMNQITRNHFLLLLALIFATTVCVAMVAARWVYSDSRHYFFLLWNLALAWLPFLFAWGVFITAATPSSPLKTVWQVSLGLLWLLFFPNAPYLVTDLMHLQPLSNVPIWYDAILLFAFALTGLLLGFLSLYFMQIMVMQQFGRITSWGFVLVTVGLSSFGVYIGRFLRFNSWDVFTNPLHLLYNLAIHLDQPYLFIRSMTVSLLFSLLLLGAYAVLLSLPLVATLPQTRD